MNVDTRVTGVGVSDQWPSSSETECVLVEDDVTLILDKLFRWFQYQERRATSERFTNLALLVDTIDFGPSGIASLKFDAGTSKTSPQGIGGVPGMVMRDLAVNVVGNVSLRYTMCASCSDPGHDGTKVTKEVAIIGGQSTTGECELAGTIMREEGVSVLQERDHHEPVISPGEGLAQEPKSGRRYVPKIRNKVGTEDLEETKPIDRVVQSGHPEQDANV